MAVPVIDVVVPALDHAATLPALLATLGRGQCGVRSIVVVDRGSTDRTVEVARDAGALVLREPGGGYGAACMRAAQHFSTLPRVPDVLVFLPGDRPAAAAVVPQLVAPIAERGVELVLGAEPGRRRVEDVLVARLIDTVYRHRWSSIGPVRALRFPALVALGMRDRGAGWDVEMLVRAVKLGLTCDEVALPIEPGGGTARGNVARALLHILRHSTMR